MKNKYNCLFCQQEELQGDSGKTPDDLNKKMDSVPITNIWHEYVRSLNKLARSQQLECKGSSQTMKHNP